MHHVNKGVRRTLLIAVAVTASAVSSSVLASTIYNFKPLTTSGSVTPSSSDAVGAIGGISGAGVVVGLDSNGNAGYSNGSAPLSPLGSSSDSNINVTAISGVGIAVGSGTFNSDPTNNYAVYFNVPTAPSVMQKINGSAGANTLATAVTETAVGFEVAGMVGVGGSTRSFVWHNGDSSVTVLDPGGSNGLGNGGSSANSEATGLNSNGDVAGYAVLGSGQQHGYFYSHSTQKFYDLGDSTGVGSDPNTSANAINSSGIIVGSTVFNASLGNPEAFSYAIPAVLPTGSGSDQQLGGTFVPLGTLPGDDTSEARAINASGVIVGDSYLSSDQTDTELAFVYQNGQMENLNDEVASLPAGWTLLSATGINTAGQITGVAAYGGNDFGYVLTPTSVPEPAMLGMLGLASALGLSRRRK
jgi:probable HAF family extracellular repeat protein